jgi:hypothetical protein
MYTLSIYLLRVPLTVVALSFGKPVGFRVGCPVASASWTVIFN